MQNNLLFLIISCDSRYQSGHRFTNCSLNLTFWNVFGTLFGIIVLIFAIRILKRLSKNIGSNPNLLEDYVIWHQNNIDKSASIGNSYATNKFLIIKDRIGNIIDELEVETAKSKCYPEKYIIEVHKNFFDILDEYIDYYNENNEEKADKFTSTIRDDFLELYNSYNQIIKTIEIDSAYNELNKNK